jgi:protein PhnA
MTMTELDTALLARANHKCEICESTDTLSRFDVPTDSDRDDTAVVVCAACLGQITDEEPLDPTRMFGLQGSIWSEHAAVQVLSWRLLDRLASENVWARELLEQAYLADDVLAWAREGQTDASTGGDVTRDSNGVPLAAGDTVTLIKDLDVKGTSFVAKRGTKVKGIRLSEDPGYIEGKVNGVSIMLKTEFLKKA